MIELTQINLNHCGVAKQLLRRQSATETNGNWVSNRSHIAAIQVMGRFPIQEVVDSSYEGFVVVKINGVFVCSCCAPPKWSDEEYNRMLDAHTDTLVGWMPVVIGSDFNA